MWDKILTTINEKGRGLRLENRCYLCEDEKEIVDHLLLHSCKIKTLWDLLLSTFGMFWVYLGQLKRHSTNGIAGCAKKKGTGLENASSLLNVVCLEQRRELASEERELLMQRWK